MLVQFYVCIEKERDTGFQQFAYTGVLSLFGPLACRNLSCLLWVICEVCFEIAFKELCVSPSGWYVGGVEDQTAPKSKSS
jgi:hypothetical protein